MVYAAWCNFSRITRPFKSTLNNLKRFVGKMSSDFITIDGSILEGGGQILRNAAALSCLTGKAIHVKDIRANRSNPGLRPQHLTGLQLLRDLTDGRLRGGDVGSKEITLDPKSIKSGSHMADTKTAGSICLLIQAGLPCLLYADGPSQLLLKGGTNADMAPQIDYLTMVFKPIAEKMGVRFDCDIIKRGYYPKGGGQVSISASPIQSVIPIDLTEFGKVKKITGRAFVAGVLPIKVAHQMAVAARDLISEQYQGIPIQIQEVKDSSHESVGTGTGIILIAETDTGCKLAGSALGKKGLPAQEVGQTAARMLLSNLNNGGCADEYLQDQLIIFMALAKGKSQITCGPITLHTKTAIHIAETMTNAKFETKQLDENRYLIQCEGVGLENSTLK